MSKRRIQNLLYPLGSQNIGDAAISMPDDDRKIMQEICSFDASGAAELEGYAVYNALCELAEQARAGHVCCVERVMNLHTNRDNMFVVRTLVPIDKASEAIEFINDQLSVDPKILTVADTHMESTLVSYRWNKDFSERVLDGDIAGWIDLDTPCMSIIDDSMFTRMTHLMGLKNIIYVDSNMKLSRSHDDTVDMAAANAQKLASVWGRAVFYDMNGKTYEVPPANQTLRDLRL